MTGSRRLAALALATVLGLSATAFAAGFNIYEAGARATALGGAFTATADDASAIFYNPAGMAFLQGTMIEGNLMPVVPSIKFAGAEPPAPGATGSTVDHLFPIPGVYAAHNTGGSLSYGLGVYAPFGLGASWHDPETWVGRQASYNIELAGLYVTPAVAWRFGDSLALSVGADVGWTKIRLMKYTAIPFGGDNALTNVLAADLKGTSRLNFTPCAGLMLRPAPRLSFGVMYHHNKTMQIRGGDATLTNVAPAALRGTVDAQLAALGGGAHKADADLNLPWILSTGIAYQFTDAVRGEFDVVRFGWSKFQELALDFDNPALSQSIKENYHDVWQLRFGLDVAMSPQWRAMFGYCHDNTPQPVESMSPLLPDANREDFSGGLQYRRANWRLTGSYMAVLFHSRSNVVDGQVRRYETTLPAGTYDSIAHIFGLGVGYDF